MKNKLMITMLQTIKEKAHEVNDLHFDDIDEERKAVSIAEYITERVDLMQKALEGVE